MKENILIKAIVVLSISCLLSLGMWHGIALA
jgi:hypothetical protein